MSLAQLRRTKGHSQRSLGKEAQVSHSTIYEIEAGRHSPNPSTVRKLAEALDVTPEEVIEAVEGPKVSAPPSYREPTLNDVLDEERRAQDLGRDWAERVHEILEYHEDALQESFGHASRLSTIGEEYLARDVRVKAIRTFQAAYMYVYASFDDGRRHFPDVDTPELAQAMAEWLKRVDEVEEQRPEQRGGGGKVVELKEWRKSA